jgi:hypothetical protein
MEAANVLGAFRDHLVIVGGWVPELLFPNKGHIGSLDVDFAVSPLARIGNAYETIRKRMTDAQFELQTGPTRFVKKVAGVPEPVKIDFISGQYGDGKKSDSVQVNELLFGSLRAIDLAFEASDEIEIHGSMPDGAQNTVRVRVVRAEAFILIKAFALAERVKAKDAYDIAFILHHYDPDLAALAEKMRPLVNVGLGQEAYGILKSKFATLDSVGPNWAADAIVGTADDTEQYRQAAFQDAQELFRQVER